MTALVGRQVERTLSRGSRYLPWLPGAETHEAVGQNFGQLTKPLVRGEQPMNEPGIWALRW